MEMVAKVKWRTSFVTFCKTKIRKIIGGPRAPLAPPVDIPLSEKVLHHFYFLCDIIFGALSESLPSAEIDLLYNEEFEGKAIVVTVIFANNTDPKEFLSFHKIVVDAFEVLFAKDLFVGEFFNIFLQDL